MELHKCPLGCGDIEDHGHYLLCWSEAVTLTHTESLETFKSEMFNICPDLLVLFLDALTTPVPILQSDATDVFSCAIQEAYSSQLALG